MLLELPYVDKFDMKLLSMVERFTDVYGITPIIAHAERYYPIQRKPKICIDLKNMGCLIQINCYSVIEKGRENTTAKKLIKEGLFDLLGSDCHDMAVRKPNMKSAFEKLSRDYGERICCFLEENAYLMLNNQRPRY
jgi:protein-tyrosine phosphatase